jgi:hypothetical protein
MVSSFVSVLDLKGANKVLLEVARQPNCRGHAKSELPNDLIFRSKDISNIDRVVYALLEVVESLLL